MDLKHDLSQMKKKKKTTTKNKIQIAVMILRPLNLRNSLIFQSVFEKTYILFLQPDNSGMLITFNFLDF